MLATMQDNVDIKTRSFFLLHGSFQIEVEDTLTLSGGDIILCCPLSRELRRP